MLNNPTALGASISRGTYAGNNAANAAKSHGLGKTPKVVYIAGPSADLRYAIVIPGLLTSDVNGGSINNYSVTTPTTDYFYVGNATSYAASMNETGKTYDFVAIG